MMAEKSLLDLLERQGSRFRRSVVLLFAALLALQAIVFLIVIALIWGEELAEWLPELLISSAFLFAGGLITLFLLTNQQAETGQQIRQAIDRELGSVNRARNRARALETLVGTLGSASSIEAVLDITLDVCQLILNDLGVPVEGQANAAFLLEEDELGLIASRGLAAQETELRLDRRQDIINRALSTADLMISDEADEEPALSAVPAFQTSRQVICIPLRAALGLYGLLILGLDRPLALGDEDRALLEAVADQAALALHTFKVREDLTLVQRQQLMAEEDERRIVRRTLHEGPSRSVAAVALRLALIRAMMVKDVNQATQELRRMEARARHSSQELRDMVSLLRPLALDIENLERAIEAAAQKSSDEQGLQIRFGRRTPDRRLSQQAKAIALYVVEVSLAWAKEYGQATRAEINLWLTEDALNLSIDDDGSARRDREDESLERANDLAYMLMAARVGRLGGRLDTESGPGRGVRTLMVLPLAPAGGLSPGG